MTTADRLYRLLETTLGVLPQVRIRAWDGSEAGPVNAPRIIVRSRRALRHMAWAPGELGLARAYVSGDLEIEGDLRAAMLSIRRWIDTTGVQPLRPWQVLKAIPLTAILGALGRRPTPPRPEMVPYGALHSRGRDRSVVSHHYDLSNRLYEVLLDPTMAYSCAYWTSNAHDYSLADAQRDKLDLICRKLDLRPGARLLDVGCGWGALALHAASRFGTQVTGITLSERQRESAQSAADDAGLGDRVTIRLSDYRDLADEMFDAVAVVEMGEHVGKREYWPFISRVAAALLPSGRLLVQQMSRAASAPGGGAFIERYIASDMYMQPISRTLAAIEDAGLEVRDVHALREHYVRTIDAWAGELDRRRSDAEAAVGAEWVRVWRLYLAGSALAFEQNRMGVDQILAVKTEANGRAGLDRTRSAWEATSSGYAAR